MTEAERLQKIVNTQEKELRRIRSLLSVARTASATFDVVDGKLMVWVTCIGVDEYYFTEQAKPELTKIAEAILKHESGSVELNATEVMDGNTGEKAEGGVIPQP